MLTAPLGLDVWEVRPDHLVLQADEAQAARLEAMGYAVEQLRMTESYLSDFATARAGLRIARQIYATEPMAGLIQGESVPGADVQTDEQSDAHVRATAGTVQHPVGTCAMGTGSNAVVDPELRVHGLAGLRVVDASVMPDVPGGNTNGPTIMIAEKAADLIRGRATARITTGEAA